MKRRPKKNIYGELLFYDDPFPWEHKTDLNRTKQYWTAISVAEDSLARIHDIQQIRKDEEGDIKSILLDDEIFVLKSSVELLIDSIEVIEHIRVSDSELPDDMRKRVKEWSDDAYLGDLHL